MQSSATHFCYKSWSRGRKRGEKYLISIQVTSIQVQDCLLAWFLILVLVSRLVRHYLVAVYSLSAYPSSRGTQAFACKSFHKMSALLSVPYQFIIFCLTGSKWPVQWGDPRWPDGSQLFLSRWIFHMLLCVPQLRVSRWPMHPLPSRRQCSPGLQPLNVKFLRHLETWHHPSLASISRQNSLEIQLICELDGCYGWVRGLCLFCFSVWLQTCSAHIFPPVHTGQGERSV